jgi:polar amino acid transport system permease protein
MIDILSRFGTSLLIGQFPHGPLGGIDLTVVMSAVALLCAFPFAVGIAMARTSPITAIRRLAAVYVYFVRGVPLLLLIFWAYFVVPLVVGFGTSATITVICALVAYEGAYLGEAIRGALEALPRGQVEASRSLGLGFWSTTTYVVLPQVLVSCLPSMVNQFIILVKDTSLASLVGVHELTFSANQINAQLLTQPLEVYALLATAYFVLCFALSRLSQFLEGKIAQIRSGSTGIAAVAATAEAI